MNFAQRAVARTSVFVSDHKTALTITATAVTTFVVCAKVARMTKDGYVEAANEFLTSKGLMTEFTETYFADPIV